MKNNYTIGSIVEMKKQHPCGNNKFVITRIGVDIKIKCTLCNHTIMLSRIDFNKKIKKVLEVEND